MIRGRERESYSDTSEYVKDESDTTYETEAMTIKINTIKVPSTGTSQCADSFIMKSHSIHSGEPFFENFPHGHDVQDSAP